MRPYTQGKEDKRNAHIPEGERSKKLGVPIYIEYPTLQSGGLSALGVSASNPESERALFGVTHQPSDT